LESIARRPGIGERWPVPRLDGLRVWRVQEPDFNTLGSQGWELCAAVGQYPTSSVPVTFVFKRPVRGR
jgi:hypothetical protein